MTIKHSYSMATKNDKLTEKILIDVIASCAALERKAQLALSLLAGGGKPANARKGKVNTTELITKRRKKIFANATH